ncbi:hypothetical protein T484DRAFT_1937342 [Baffinella frigidus]|nr:hypothetical protein T484DRAFT_1937342 [Cryptophyta sp. CCMP2293]
MLRISPVGALGALFLVLLQSAACSEPARITEVEHFESVVLKSADIYLVLFTFESDDPIRGRGVNQEQCRKVEAGMSALIEKLAPLGITVMVADVEDVSAIASEFNVRKRMLPQALLFKTRARNGDVFKADVLMDPEQALAEVQKALEENPRREGGGYDKITLQLGGGDL